MNKLTATLALGALLALAASSSRPARAQAEGVEMFSARKLKTTSGAEV
jgi:hypothetical protein